MDFWGVIYTKSLLDQVMAWLQDIAWINDDKIPW